MVYFQETIPRILDLQLISSLQLVLEVSRKFKHNTYLECIQYLSSGIASLN